MQGGTKAELDINALLRKRGAVIATALRSRTARGEGRHLCRGRRARLAARRGRCRSCPVIHERLPLEEVETAHRLMEDSGHIGKIVLTL